MEVGRRLRRDLLLRRKERKGQPVSVIIDYKAEGTVRFSERRKEVPKLGTDGSSTHSLKGLV